jgi:hypothetical protein
VSGPASLCEGRKPLSETRPEVVALARKLRRRQGVLSKEHLPISQIHMGPPIPNCHKADMLNALTGGSENIDRAFSRHGHFWKLMIVERRE